MRLITLLGAIFSAILGALVGIVSDGLFGVILGGLVWCFVCFVYWNSEEYKVDVKREEYKKLQAQVKELQDQVNVKRGEYRELQAQVDVKRGEYRELQAQVKELQAQVNVKRGEYRELQAQVDVKRGEYKELQAQVDVKQREYKKLQQRQQERTDGTQVEVEWSKISVGGVITGKPYVIDGDGLKIAGQEIRLYGIDAPEWDQPYYGKRAKDELYRFVQGRKIYCKVKDRDERYKRVIGECYREGEEDSVNGWMVEQGWAIAYTRYSKDYEEQEARARRYRRGIWRGLRRDKNGRWLCGCMNPERWRHDMSDADKRNYEMHPEKWSGDQTPEPENQGGLKKKFEKGISVQVRP